MCPEAQKHFDFFTGARLPKEVVLEIIRHNRNSILHQALKAKKKGSQHDFICYVRESRELMEAEQAIEALPEEHEVFYER
jgi:hypothetical protein